MTRVAALMISVTVVFVPTDLPIQCEDSNYRRINPQVCGEQIYPFPEFGHGGGGSSAGGGGGRGILGRILDGIGLGGLL